MSEAFDPYHKWIGIPPNERPADYYRLLGINRFESDPEVIAHAADQRMAHVKSFQAGKYSVQSQQMLNEIAAAKVVLLNPGKKATYDRQLQRRAIAPASPSAHFPYRSKQFWRALACGLVAVTLCIAAVAFFLARRGAEHVMPTDEGRRAAGESEAVAKLPQPSTSDKAAAETTARHAPVLPIADEPAAIGPRGADHPAAGTTSHAPPNENQRIEVPAPHARVEAQLDQESKSHPATDPTMPARKEKPATSQPAYLDDLKEMDFSVGWGALGKHGATGYPKQANEYGTRVTFKGRARAHALSVHPPSKGASCVVYNLAKEFRVFKATAAIMEVNRANAATLEGNPLFMGKAYSPLRFVVLGDGKPLWRSRRIQNSGDCQDCSVRVEGVSLLELQVHCPGINAFAWAAWIEPRVSR